ncbi:FecCD family ABC transporter permease [Cryptosporangium minutisporangium]|uniref:Iron chelate uptake ABC transporter family permease subunit n=1 Tax=Cryptosporangium minutisporangium TaxID=113569 RepID=A0ABP6T417_9ACTN
MSALLPPRSRILRAPGDRVSLRIDLRTTSVCVGLLVAVLVIGAVATTTGDFRIPLLDVGKAIFGAGDPATDFIVRTLRLPRFTTAVVAGAAMAVSGAIFQNLSGNPLGSPDVIGFQTGAATGALLVLLVTDDGPVELGAVTGCLVTAAAVYLLAFRGGVQGFRMILIGIGINAMLVAANNYLITRASLQDALGAQVWLVGSLNGRGWDQALPTLGVLVVLLPIALAQNRRASILQLGDEAAKGLGVPVERTRGLLIAVGVLLTGVAVAAAGPVTFVALAAPQLARRLTRSSAPGLVPAALMGAVLLSGSDLLAQRLFSPEQLPVGIMTGALGGAYLAWLLASEWRRGRNRV